MRGNRRIGQVRLCRCFRIWRNQGCIQRCSQWGGDGVQKCLRLVDSSRFGDNAKRLWELRAKWKLFARNSISGCFLGVKRNQNTSEIWLKTRHAYMQSRLPQVYVETKTKLVWEIGYGVGD